MAEARVTVAIPTRNRAELLGLALESVLGQSIPEIEVFVSDNASEDATPDVVASFGDPRVHYERLDSNIGLHGNLSRCLHLGTAPYLALLFDDDLMLPGALERKVGVLDNHHEVGMVESAFHVIGPDGRVLRENASFGAGNSDIVAPGEYFIRRAFAESFRIMSAPVFRRKVIADESYEEADEDFCDFGLFLRVALRTGIAFIAEPLLLLRFHEASMTVQSGLATFNSSTYRHNFSKLALEHKVKERFLREHWHDVTRPEELRSLSRRWTRGQLLELVKQFTYPERHLRATARSLLEASRVEPSVVFTRDAMRYLTGSAVGSRGRDLIRRARARLSWEARS